MKKCKYYFSLLLMLSPIVYADSPSIITRNPLNIPNRGPLNFSGIPADRQQYQSIITNSDFASLHVCNSDQTTYDLYRIDVVPLVGYSGISFNPGASFYTYFLFNSTMDAYKIVPVYSSTEFNGPNMPPSSAMQSIYKEKTVAWTGPPMSDSLRRMKDNKAATGGVPMKYGYYIYKAAVRPPTGQYSLAPMPSPNNLVEYQCVDGSGAIRETQLITMTPIDTTLKVTGCTPDQKEDVVKMDPISIADLEAARISNSTVGNKARSFSLKCDPDVKVHFSLVDLTDQSNISTISKLTSDSTATGVGYQVSYGAHPMKFGPDISAAFPEGDATVDRILIKTTGSSGANIPISFSLNFSYAPNGDAIKKGTANSLIGITYSYQ